MKFSFNAWRRPKLEDESNPGFDTEAQDQLMRGSATEPASTALNPEEAMIRAEEESTEDSDDEIDLSTEEHGGSYNVSSMVETDGEMTHPEIRYADQRLEAFIESHKTPPERMDPVPPEEALTDKAAEVAQAAKLAAKDTRQLKRRIRNNSDTHGGRGREPVDKSKKGAETIRRMPAADIEKPGHLQDLDQAA